ncbi:MAG: phosphohistidine phosphatase SixA [Thermodesulfobacteriota bacterium]
MKLFLVQHGKQNPKEKDPEQGLSEKGISDVQRVAEFLSPHGIHVSALWHSGKRRAAQSAEILARSITSREGVVSREGLSPLDPIEPVFDAIGSRSDDLMIVGHLPFLSKLLSRLVAGSETSEVVAFQQGGIVCLERDAEGVWRIRWFVVPDLLP